MSGESDEEWLVKGLAGALTLVARAVSRLPYGETDPVLAGGGAGILYTGGSEQSVELDLLVQHPGSLTEELGHLGFDRWAKAAPGETRLRHRQCQHRVRLIDGGRPLDPAVAANLVSLELWPEHANCGELPPLLLSVLGIEDVIADETKRWCEEGGRPGAASCRIQALVELGRAGVCGGFRPAYLHRRLTAETLGAAALEPPPAAAALDGCGPRRVGLRELLRAVTLWKVRRGLVSDFGVVGRCKSGAETLGPALADRLGGDGEGEHKPSARIISFRRPAPAS